MTQRIHSQLATVTICFTLLAIQVVSPLRADTCENTGKSKRPDGAIVLFDGEDSGQLLSMSGGAINWPIEDGALVSTRGNGRSNHLVSKLHFRDAELHVEFRLPEKGTGNSGIYLHGNYELQIYNSADKANLTMNDMGAIYGFSKPITNAAKKPGEWQTYDITYRAPRRDPESGKIIEDGQLTAKLNGQLVQKDTKFGDPRSNYHPFRYGTTPYLKTIWSQQQKTGIGPLFLQDHDNAVQFRNVWIKPLDNDAFEYDPEGE